jgi:hypothetical protein
MRVANAKTKKGRKPSICGGAQAQADLSVCFERELGCGRARTALVNTAASKHVDSLGAYNPVGGRAFSYHLLTSATPLPRRRSELQDALYRTRIRAVKHQHNLFAMEARYESKNCNIDSGPVFSASKISAGTLKNNTVVYEAADDSIKVTIDGSAPDGTATHSEWTGKFDGKDYPSTGNPNEDMRSVRQIDDHTLEVTSKKGAKVVLTAHVVVAADGKSRRVTVNGTDAKGKKYKSTAVYDKQ